jgi:cytochrome c oxidase assembly factor CtaG
MRLIMRRLLPIAAVLFTAASAFAHEPGIAPSNWRTAWSWEPAIAIPIGASGILYAIGILNIYRRKRRASTIRRWEIASFVFGWLALILALDSPLHKLGEVLFSAHMTQHELLMVLAAPLLVLGRPLVVFLFAFPASWRPAASGWTKWPLV